MYTCIYIYNEEQRTRKLKKENVGNPQVLPFMMKGSPWGVREKYYLS